MTERRIAVLVETSHASAREALRGMLEFIRDSGAKWRLDHEPRRLESGPPEWLRHWKGDGIIARCHCPKSLATIRRAGVPAVDLLGVARHPSVAMVLCDERAISRLAAEHLIACGLQSFAFVGAKSVSWSENRRVAFQAAIEQAGYTTKVFNFPRHHRLAVPPEDRVLQLAEWLRSLPRPVGIMGANDQYAAFTATACQVAGIAVPDEVAIAGVDNDEVFCELASPPITSVMADHFAIGFESAKLLAQLMDGRVAVSRPAEGGRPPAGDWLAVAVPPRGILERRSTDFQSAPDTDVAAALRLIREHFRRPLTVRDVAAKLAVSRATLVRRFAAVLGHGFHEEVIAARLREAKRLLTSTDTSLEAVARQSGFVHPQQMRRVFRSRLGVTPAAWRAAHRRR